MHTNFEDNFSPSKTKLCMTHGIIKQSRLTSLMWETLSMPQNGLQHLLMIPTTLPVGFLAASATDILNCSDIHKHRGH